MNGDDLLVALGNAPLGIIDVRLLSYWDVRPDVLPAPPTLKRDFTSVELQNCEFNALSP